MKNANCKIYIHKDNSSNQLVKAMHYGYIDEDSNTYIYIHDESNFLFLADEVIGDCTYTIYPD